MKECLLIEGCCQQKISAFYIKIIYLNNQNIAVLVPYENDRNTF